MDLRKTKSVCSRGKEEIKRIRRKIGRFENLFKTKMVLFAARVIRSARTNNTMYTQPANWCSEYSVAIFNLTNISFIRHHFLMIKILKSTCTDMYNQEHSLYSNFSQWSLIGIHYVLLIENENLNLNFKNIYFLCDFWGFKICINVCVCVSILFFVTTKKKDLSLVLFLNISLSADEF